MLNDCLYRYMYTSKYIAFVDLDEFILPRYHYSWNDLFKSLEKKEQETYLTDLILNPFGNWNQPCAFIFQCLMFNINWPDEDDESPKFQDYKIHNIMSLKKSRRKPYPHNERTKAIVIPQLVDAMRVHTVKQCLGSFKPYHVPYTTAALHHYRLWNDQYRDVWVIDKTAFKYSAMLLDNIIKINWNVTHS